MARPRTNLPSKELLEEWDWKTNIGDPDQTNYSEKVWWLGKCGHSWQSFYGNRIKGVGCPICCGKAILIGFNDLCSQMPELSKEWHPKNILSSKQVTVSSGRNMWWLGGCGHEWRAIVSNRSKRGDSCPKCFRGSRFEGLVSAKIDKMYSGNVIRNSRPLKYSGGRLELDFWLPEIELAFEVQDFATHSRTSDGEEGRFKKVRLIKRGPGAHELKRKLAREQLNTILVDLWEDVIIDDEKLSQEIATALGNVGRIN